MATALLDDWAPLHHQQSSSSSPAASTTQSGGPQQQQKKPRHRHSPEQLAALNELFDKNEHPPLEARTALAERLGMETKNVNSWFQNKRSSHSKRRQIEKRRREEEEIKPPQIPAPPQPLSAATTPGAHHRDLDEDDHHSSHSAPGHFSPNQKVSHAAEITPGSSFFAANPDHYFGSRDSPDPNSMNRKMRMRPTAEQTEELKKLYSITPHPTSEERQALAERIGMRYQSVTNWYQNMRSGAKRRQHPDISSNSRSDLPHHHSDMRQYSAFPPRPPHQIHPSLVSDSAAVPPSSLSSSTEGGRAHRSPSVSPSMDEQHSRRATMRRSTTPYGGPMQSRPRRSRPEPYQLDALKGLFNRTSTPTIEERSALALEIGMEVGRITNWFRNLRQSRNLREKRRKNGHGAEQDTHGMGSGSGEEDDDMLDHDQLLDDESPRYSSAVSRAGTPSRFSSASSSSMGDRELETRMRRQVPHSNIPSEDDDYPEAVTPENGRSPSPRLERRAMHSSKPMHHRELLPPPSQMLVDHRDPYPSSSSPYPPHPFYMPPPSFPPNQHYSGPLPPMDVSGRPPMEPKSSLGFGRFNAAISLSEPSFYPKPHPHPYLDEDPIRCAKAAERFGIKLEDAYLLLDFKFHRQ